MRRVSVAVLFLAALLVTSNVYAATQPLRVAIVDVQTVLETTTEGKRARDALEQDRAEKTKILETKRDELKKLEEEYTQKRLVWKGKILQEKTGALQQRTVELQKLVMDAESQFKKRSDQLSKGILDKIKGVITKYGVDKGFDFVLEKNSVFYFKTAFDITPEVIRTYNKTYK